MRLPAEGRQVRPARFVAVLTLAVALGAHGTAAARPAPAPPPPANGPRADYPVVVGERYTVDGVDYVPEDVLNYDQVGFVAADDAGGSAISGAHHTLALPSYVEVTSLDSGRTVLVRLERRGPMTGPELVALSPGALDQLGVAPGAAVRVRRVNPPEDQRALLRAGQPAPLRMDTPMPLVEVLRRKLPGAAPAPAAGPIQAVAAAPAPDRAATVPPTTPRQSASRAAPPAAEKGLPALPPLALSAAAAVTPAAARPVPASAGRPAVDREGAFVVQAAAFSTAERAARVAGVLGGDVTRSGAYFRVRTGPFATRGEAEASLAKVQAAGYRDARIFTSG